MQEAFPLGHKSVPSEEDCGSVSKKSSSLIFEEWVQASGGVSSWEAESRLSVLMKRVLRDLQPDLFVLLQRKTKPPCKGSRPSRALSKIQWSLLNPILLKRLCFLFFFFLL